MILPQPLTLVDFLPKRFHKPPQSLSSTAPTATAETLSLSVVDDDRETSGYGTYERGVVNGYEPPSRVYDATGYGTSGYGADGYVVVDRYGVNFKRRHATDGYDQSLRRSEEEDKETRDSMSGEDDVSEATVTETWTEGDRKSLVGKPSAGDEKTPVSGKKKKKKEKKLDRRTMAGGGGQEVCGDGDGVHVEGDLVDGGGYGDRSGDGRASDKTPVEDYGVNADERGKINGEQGDGGQVNGGYANGGHVDGSHVDVDGAPNIGHVDGGHANIGQVDGGHANIGQVDEAPNIRHVDGVPNIGHVDGGHANIGHVDGAPNIGHVDGVPNIGHLAPNIGNVDGGHVNRNDSGYVGGTVCNQRAYAGQPVWYAQRPAQIYVPNNYRQQPTFDGPVHQYQIQTPPPPPRYQFQTQPQYQLHPRQLQHQSPPQRFFPYGNQQPFFHLVPFAPIAPTTCSNGPTAPQQRYQPLPEETFDVQFPRLNSRSPTPRSRRHRSKPRSFSGSRLYQPIHWSGGEKIAAEFSEKYRQTSSPRSLEPMHQLGQSLGPNSMRQLERALEPNSMRQQERALEPNFMRQRSLEPNPTRQLEHPLESNSQEFPATSYSAKPNSFDESTASKSQDPTVESSSFDGQTSNLQSQCQPELRPDLLAPPSQDYRPLPDLVAGNSKRPPRITHVFDMDGFFVRDRFLCKELAVVEVDTNQLFYERFRMGVNLHELSRLDQQNVRYVTNCVHGIEFADRDDVFLGQDDVELVVDFFLRCGDQRRRREDVLVAYKGGYIERDLLNKLGIASFNLENIGCPKYNLLRKQESLATAVAEIDRELNCDLHKPASGRKIFHCCMREIALFRRWYLQRFSDVE